MVESLRIDIAGEPMELLADRALYWPREQRLLIADLHLGKGDTFRAAGIPVPTGGTTHDLRRIDALLRATGAHALWILGDFLHARRHAAVDAAWRALRDAHGKVAFGVVPGNHDRALDAGIAGVDVIAEDTLEPPFVFRHAPPDAADANAHVICGHVHPVLRLPGAGRHPVFWLQPRMTVLPAFSAFTGGHAVRRAPGTGLVACNGSLLLRLP
ncbi:ligase-associated DNA damage response endonuclease PdeM [Luteimonas aestuarii]|uniref:Ligase-associated DNA damage response endonuclease PdeM n=1 Tax=Luteimonas aestuarii TaxID=453837 RepID=A0A4R5U0Z2_9GAMM|nr:ligase-associated DNA damage response endonuclease PdeM [Luteimonas aestuarii]TDK27214.1 ligase-associated DNA damage response endonuclease PdeM [Luteimonas aestuarii]